MARRNGVVQGWPNNGSRARRGGTAGRLQSGFTYLGVLMLVAIMGALLAATGEVWSTVIQRQKEQQLLFVGHQFREAIRQYYERSPGGVKRYPRSLDDLLLDKRYPTTQRYLRKIYFDPMTGKPEWGLLKAPDEGIAGVYSLARGTPIKVDNFATPDAAFKGAQRYSRWQFSYQLVQPGTANGSQNTLSTSDAQDSEDAADEQTQAPAVQ
ncbi:type II secretion system protein [Pseudogulbenkiania subflava]|uniref:Type II secretory pathway, pseudopilin PulG n=1 Tax=Pseudogulbenkiania subflava DSM 22618 TaxID=1123014 RepID=A0A1Y6BVG7_9NEIS|nr:type II secretion system protein [Pseudogulbenkiania subflava]SMF30809.1 Type II secretory pathway, pseudopilin PulG [Pseudogulbenkiania subflava DSM 22618]